MSYAVKIGTQEQAQRTYANTPQARRVMTVDTSGNYVSGNGGTQYDVDDVAGGTDTGTLALVIRDDTLTTLTPADGDYTGLRVGSTGALHVTGGGGGTEYTEDEVTANPQIGTATLVERDDVISTVTPVEGDWIGLRGSAEGALWTQDFNSDDMLTSLQLLDNAISGNEMQVDIITSALPTGASTSSNQLPDGHNVTIDNASGGSAVNIQDGGNSITIDGSVALIDNPYLRDDSAFSIGSSYIAALGGVFTTDTVDAGDIAAVRIDANRNIFTNIVDISSGTQTNDINIADGGNSITVDSTNLDIRHLNRTDDEVSVIQSQDVSIKGNVANDAADSGNPIKIGGKARQTNPTAVADADRVDSFFDDTGKQVVILNAPRDLVTSDTTTISDTTETTILSSGGAGVFHDIVQLELYNGSSSSVRVDIRESTSGTIIQSVHLAPKGGKVSSYQIPIPQGTANNNWTAQLDTAVTDVRIFVQAVKNI